MQKNLAGILFYGKVQQAFILRAELCRYQAQKQGGQKLQWIFAGENHRFMKLKNSALVLVDFSLSSMNSMAWASSIGCNSFLSIHIFCN